MEVASLIIGISGLLAVADKALVISQIIADVRNFGDDTAETLFKLAHESQTFHSLIAMLSEQHERSHYSTAEPGWSEHGSSKLKIDLEKHLADAFARFQIGLEQAEMVLNNYGLLEWEKAASEPSYNVGGGTESRFKMLGLSQASPGLSVILEHKKRALALKHRLSLRKKVAFQAKPWGTSDKQTLVDAVTRMSYWNQAVTSILSTADRIQLDSHVQCQIMASTDDDCGLDVLQSYLQDDSELNASAALFRKRIEIQQPYDIDGKSVIDQSPFFENWNTWEFGASNVGHQDLARPKEIHPHLTDRASETESTVALVDWIGYGRLTKPEKLVAVSKIEQLCELLKFENKPQKLGILPGLGFLDDVVRKRYGLLLRLPESISGSEISSVSLAQVLDMATTKGKERPVQSYKPSLPERFQLARRLAQTFLELHKVRWFHKGFDSRKVIFFCSNQTTGDPPVIMFGDPFVIGFEFSRPSGKENISLPLVSTPGFEVYSHPDLRTGDPSANPSSNAHPPTAASPRFKAAYDIFSLSSVLLEIGLWTPLKYILPRYENNPRDTQRLLQGVAKQNLGHTMGSKYRDAVLLGLRWVEDSGPKNGYRAGADEGEVAMVDVQRMFFDIMRPLEECACGSYS